MLTLIDMKQTKKKGLQKFTESEAKINKILSLEQITRSALEPLSKPEQDRLFAVLTEQLNNSKGIERDKICKKIELFAPEETKNQLWEYNHNQITWAISTLMQDCGRMPTKREIATKTELSRQTVHKHLKEYASNPLYIQEIEQFRFMTSKVLAKVFKFAVNGDMGAAKLYFNVMGNLNNGQTSNNTLIQTQNNYIQINGTVLSQDNIKRLNPEQLEQMEAIIKTAIPQPETIILKK